MDLAINYKKSPPKDDFMADVLELIGNDAFDDPNKDEDEEF